MIETFMETEIDFGSLCERVTTEYNAECESCGKTTDTLDRAAIVLEQAKEFLKEFAALGKGAHLFCEECIADGSADNCLKREYETEEK